MNKDRNEILAALQLSRLPSVGAAKFKELIKLHHKPTSALAYFLMQNSGLTSLKSPLNLPQVLEYLDTHLSSEITWPFQKDYPQSLLDISEPPPVLFYEGKANVLLGKERKVAIVGSRQMTTDGAILTKKITEFYCRQGVTIISGLAEGVDTIAHQTAITCSSPTIAVIATGINICFPKKNLALFRTIKESGAICTEFFPDTPPRSSFFPTRNRIIAALADEIIMIEGQAKSGALYTVKNGIRFGKKVWIPDFSKYQLNDAGLIKAKELGANGLGFLPI